MNEVDFRTVFLQKGEFQQYFLSFDLTRTTKTFKMYKEFIFESENIMFTVGIDLGGTNIAVGICDEGLNIVKKGSVPTNAGRDPELIVKDMAALTVQLLDEAAIALSDVVYSVPPSNFA